MLRDIPQKCHTNIVKLFNAHKDAREKGNLKAPGHHKIYIPGLGTRFQENREWRESAEGKAFGKGGEARILFALLQVYNAVHREFGDNPTDMFDTDAITAKIQQYAKDVETSNPLRDASDPRPDRRSWFADLTKELDPLLRKARKDRPKPDIPKITLNVFGFSRGAVEARAFCYWFADLLKKDGTFAGMDAEIAFLGLFESVASIGLANSASETTPLFFADGHFSWAREVREALPPCVRKTVHYIAAHEQRRNFPITRVKGDDVTEYLYPGVHSDVGGGYSPGDHGRGVRMGMMVSQIPLLHMHREASRAGAPLLSYSEMDDRLKKDYDIDSDLSAAWNTYMAALKFPTDVNNIATGNYQEMVQRHMELYCGFRRRWLNEFTDLPSYDRASAQDKEDLNSYNNLLKGDLALLRKRKDFAAQG
ncbi:T6SS phospholipase effector Tle1-like catalytic domain-containing protein, partial [Collimonas silvisoli]|uniref:T6SS phospholipase effector Tle1-like catalytic domain-containing protein n=1 Tax=Collimonas silvisoli TaxID=2825884 RepID=UPI001B8BEB2B